jgi:chemotaxis regulatin CheY-phosphate phosphatase CheZ
MGSISHISLSTRANNISTRASDISDRANDIANRTNDIANRTNDIANRTNDIADHTNDIADHTNDIADRANGIYASFTFFQLFNSITSAHITVVVRFLSSTFENTTSTIFNQLADPSDPRGGGGFPSPTQSILIYKTGPADKQHASGRTN